jgi:AcrR family transcriptional regulator
MAADVASATARNRPGRHRSEAADQAILAATLDVLAAEGYGGLTMAAVIARSGVSSATLYRRWPTKQELVAAAMASLHPAVVDVDTGSLEGDITAFVRSLAGSLTPKRDDLSQDVAVALSRHPEFRAAVNEKFVVPRVLVLGHVLDRARNRGELGRGEPGRRLTAEAATSFVIGPLHHRVYVMGRAASPAFQKGVVTAAVASLRALAPPD